MLMKILGTGLSGLVGSRVVELLKDQYKFESSEVDVTDRESIINKIKTSDAPIVLHLAAKTSVDGCEKDRGKDIRTFCHPELVSGSYEMLNQVQHDTQKRFWTGQNDEEWRDKKTAWGINVYGTKNIVDACEKNNKKLMYISTDFVFDGSRKTYNETDKQNPINWYGATKYEGEKIVQKASIPWIIVRLAYPYRAHFAKKDFVRILIDKFEKGESLQMVTDHIITPTFIDDVAYALDALIKNNATGIFHVVGSEFISPYEAALKIAKVFNYDKKNITNTTRLKFFRNRAQRPFHLALKNDKIQNLGVKMRSFEEGLKEVKRQVDVTLSS